MIQGEWIYAEIIGNQKPQQLNKAAQDQNFQPALIKCYLKKYREAGVRFQNNSSTSISSHSYIYLIAHGKSSMFNKRAGLDYPLQKNKIKQMYKSQFSCDTSSPQFVAFKIQEILKKMDKKLEFQGKIILQICHSAQPMVDSETMAKAMEINKKYDVNEIFHQFKKQLKPKIGSPSLLVEVQKILLNKKSVKERIGKNATISGYLGESYDSSNARIYGTVQCSNLLSILYQQKIRGIKNKHGLGGVKYNEDQSFYQCLLLKKSEFRLE